MLNTFSLLNAFWLNVLAVTNYSVFCCNALQNVHHNSAKTLSHFIFSEFTQNMHDAYHNVICTKNIMVALHRETPESVFYQLILLYTQH